MRIKVEVLPWLSEAMGGSLSEKVLLEETGMEGDSLRDLLEWLCAAHPRFGKLVFNPRTHQLTGHAEIAVNGTIYDAIGGLDTPLHEGDTVTFLPGIAGGSRRRTRSVLPAPLLQGFWSKRPS